MEGNNYYEVLGVRIDATTDEIKSAYLELANTLHPDRLGTMPEHIRERAEAILKKVNVAYGVLSNEARRKEYDRSRYPTTGSIPHFSQSTSAKTFFKKRKSPKPEVVPKTVDINNAFPYVPQRTYFIIQNNGGTCRKVFVSTPPSWLKVTKTTSIQDGTNLPMLVELEGMGTNWEKTLSTKITVKLDDKQTKLKVRLHTQAKPR